MQAGNGSILSQYAWVTWHHVTAAQGSRVGMGAAACSWASSGGGGAYTIVQWPILVVTAVTALQPARAVVVIQSRGLAGQWLPRL